MKKIGLYTALFAIGLSFHSCLTYDNPGDEDSLDEKRIDKVLHSSNVDSLNYKFEDATIAQESSTKLLNLIQVAVGGQFSMRGGKDGGTPGPHAYQYQYSLGADNYAQYAVIPHVNFPYSGLNITSAYNIDPKAYGGAAGAFGKVMEALVPILNTSDINNLPELKAAYLLLFNFAAIERADIYGPFPYRMWKTNRFTTPLTYDRVEDIYNDVLNNVDTAIVCFKHFENKPQAYKEHVMGLLNQRFFIMDKEYGTPTIEHWWRFANSFKLRLAMHMVKADAVRARKLAEEAVASGVIEERKHEVKLAGSTLGFSHPLVGVSQWNDTRMTASMECLIHSLKHPYSVSGYLWEPNSEVITNSKTGAILNAGTRITGMRSGSTPGDGQSYADNQYIAFSRVSHVNFESAPLYIMKLAEVCFLRAEGAIRGWNMNGNAKDFYEQGIINGSFEDPHSLSSLGANGENTYDAAMNDYLQLERPVPYTYVDPTGDTDDVPSPTTIGVKWNDGDDREIKLEKIITQKYLALFPNSFEAWVDLRRTGYPKLLPVLNYDEGDGSLQWGDIIRRLPFPDTSDISVRQDVDATGIPALGGSDLINTRLWWDRNPSNF